MMPILPAMLIRVRQLSTIIIRMNRDITILFMRLRVALISYEFAATRFMVVVLREGVDRSQEVTKRSLPVTTRSHPVPYRLRPVPYRLRPVTAWSHPVTPRSLIGVGARVLLKLADHNEGAPHMS